MNDFDSCVYRIVKQIYSVLVYEYEMGLSEPRVESSDIFSLQFLRSLHEHPVDNVHKILLRQIETAVTSTEKQFSTTDNKAKKILMEFLSRMNNMKSQVAQRWLMLQHYMHYIYRNFTSPNPQSTVEDISEMFLKDMRSLVVSLTAVDETQLYLRIFSLLREYTTYAYWQYNRTSEDKQHLVKLYNCYQSYLNASKNLSSVFLDFEAILKDKCNMTWMDFNKFIFFNYFYEANNIHVISRQTEQGIEPASEEFLALYENMKMDFDELNALWLTLKQLRTMNDMNDKEMTSDHERVLNKNFWIPRTKDELLKQNMNRLAAELVILASERRVRGSDPILGKSGQCLCEDCLILKLDSLTHNNSSGKMICDRLSPCRICHQSVDLNKFHEHVCEHLEKIEYTRLTKDKYNANSNRSDISTSSDSSDNSVVKCEQTNDPSPATISNSDLTILQDLPCEEQVQPVSSPKVRPKENLPGNIPLDEVKENISTKCEAANPSSPPCSHNCKHEEELKAELKKLQGTCDHHKDSKRCDCTYCEVFGSSVANHLHKSNETRNRLRIRLNQRKQKLVSKSPLMDKTNKLASVKPNLSVKQADPIKTTTIIENGNQIKGTTIVKTTVTKPAEVLKTVPKPTPPTEPLRNGLAPKQTQTPTLFNDIPGLIDYIEGNSGTDKMVIAQKKAAKKARQRQKKEEEKQRIEEEERREAEEKRRAEEARLRALRLLEKEKNRINEDNNKKNSKKRKNKEKVITNNSENKPRLVEETIPAMVTIKRAMENGENLPTVTITLKGSTPDQDKLLYTLVNGQTNGEKSNKSKKNKQKTSNQTEQKSEHLVKLQVLRQENGKTDNGKIRTSLGNEVKVSLAVNKNETNSENAKTRKQIKSENRKNNEIQNRDFPLLRLPPGITITKVDGPISQKNFRISMNGVDGPGGSVPVNNSNNNSGVIVVDTEKLGHTNDSKETSNNTSRRSRKKKNKKQSENQSTQPSMITLKNPIFQNLSDNNSRDNPMSIDIAGSSCAQASIFKNENGMVTIRSSRLQQSLSNGVPMHSLLSDLKPVMGADVVTPTSNTCSLPEATMSPFNAQEILSGLPGIEITKVDRKSAKVEHENKSCQVAQVSIIPTINGDKCALDKDDWLYDSVFTPKDILEDDMDPEELELEAFKRFCQQSVPPKRKEKVAHLNVKDIVLKKKNEKSTV